MRELDPQSLRTFYVKTQEIQSALDQMDVATGSTTENPHEIAKQQIEYLQSRLLVIRYRKEFFRLYGYEAKKKVGLQYVTSRSVTHV